MAKQSDLLTYELEFLSSLESDAHAQTVDAVLHSYVLKRWDLDTRGGFQDGTR